MLIHLGKDLAHLGGEMRKIWEMTKENINRMGLMKENV